IDAIVGVVPNFSEGRDAGVIAAIVSALHVPGARVVYAEADPDHHRLDTTVLGAPDSIPFMPVRGVTIDQCVTLARDFGRALAETLEVPVYLYDRAALSPER